MTAAKKAAMANTSMLRAVINLFYYDDPKYLADSFCSAAILSHSSSKSKMWNAIMIPVVNKRWSK